YICGRAKNLIVSAGGKNIYPEEIEGKLLESGLIAEARVLGRKKKGGQGEEVRALLFPDLEEMSARLAADQVANHSDELRERLIRDVVESVNEHLADYKRISSWEIVEREFEKTASKKIKRSTYV
ncbi:MAG: hypothetical protein ACE5GA_09280, partial [Candidatus Zixiibacteriota bacterium]